MSNIDESRKNEIELLKIKVDIWKQVVNTQQHFNDLAMKIRNFAILILSAFIGAIGVSFKSGFAFVVMGHSTSVATILSFGAAIIWMLFFFVDVYWYHPLLVGSVKKGIAIESKIGDELKDFIDLTKTIGNESPKEIKFSFRKKVYKRIELHSKDKAKLFYLGVFYLLLFSTIVLYFVDSPDAKSKTLSDKKPISVQCIKTISDNSISCDINYL
ncbi:hypothetical protein E0L21_07865 [Kosakonia quasisacchari]|uniref:Uncharacterized protein n=1 Tax=Kosakonia quasisacchari TaxID=2529380 RepID=A0A4R0HT00_9ENTR|nr:hypothetical protein [Kosakonia quasisacchari]TCC12552.1 hypothetical protein E0L21_07865 [Kosakonia quasisacchari]